MIDPYLEALEALTDAIGKLPSNKDLEVLVQRISPEHVYGCLGINGAEFVMAHRRVSELFHRVRNLQKTHKLQKREAP
jgi:hypothetical protein